MMNTQDLFNRVAGAKERGNRFAFIPTGNHVLAVAHCEQRQTDKGIGVFAYFYVVESSDPQWKGQIVTQMYRLWLGSWQGDQELGRLRHFTRELAGLPDDPSSAQQIMTYGTALLDQDAGRGIIVKATGTKSKSESDWVDVAFSHVDGQSADTVAQWRAQLDQVAPLELFAQRGQTPPSIAQQPQYAPPTAQYAPPTAAPQTGLLPPAAAPAPAPATPQAAPAAALPFTIPGVNS